MVQRGAAAMTDLNGGRASARHALLAAHGEIGEGERGSGVVCFFQRGEGWFYSIGGGVRWTGCKHVRGSLAGTPLESEAVVHEAWRCEVERGPGTF